MVNKLSGRNLKNWTSKTSATQPTCKYVTLYKIAINNWMPTSNATLLTREQEEFIYKVGKWLPFNFGSIVITNILREASKSKPSNMLIYPSLIYRFLKDQGYQPPKGVVLKKELGLLSFVKALRSIHGQAGAWLSLQSSSTLQGCIWSSWWCWRAWGWCWSNISNKHHCQRSMSILPLLIQKVEDVGVLEVLKEVAVVSLNKIHDVLSPAKGVGVGGWGSISNSRCYSKTFHLPVFLSMLISCAGHILIMLGFYWC